MNLEFPHIPIATVCLILFSPLVLSTAASDEVEINTTLEDNLVILMDYSGSTSSFRQYIQSNAIYSIQNMEAGSNVSIVVYGGYIKNSNVYSTDTQDNRTILEGFVRNIIYKEGDAAKDNISDGFIEARKILYNSTGSKQMALISDGNVDGKTKGKIDNVLLIELLKDLKKNNVTINLYQVIDTDISQILKTKWIREPYRDLSDIINTKVVVLNKSERIRFFKHKPINSTYKPSVLISNQSQFTDEYLNEFSNNGDTSSIIFSMNYDQSEVSLNERDLSYATKINFYSYCDQNQSCTIIPFNIQQRIFLEKQIADIFRNKNAIELAKSGNITESAYIFSNGFSDLICGYYDSNVFNEESINLVGNVLPNVKPETTKPIKLMKFGGFISKPNYLSLGISGACIISGNDDLPNEIINGGIYTYILKNGYAYNGIVRDFQIYNFGIMEKIKDRKDSIFWSTIYIFNNPIIYHSEPLVQGNYIKLTQLSTQNYENEVELAVNRFNDKSEESRSFIDNATNKIDDLTSQIPYTFTEAILNLIEEPETNFSLAKQKQAIAYDYLNKAKENQKVYKFNSANQNSNYSIAQSREGIVFANTENSKQRHLKIWVWLFGA